MWNVTYRAGAELPGLWLPWQEETSQGVWEDLDLSTGYTFALSLETLAGVQVLDKTSGFTGADGYVSIVWATGDLEVAANRYVFKLRANETATSKDRDYSPNKWPTLTIV